jgi:hypothetical protein
MARSYSDKAFPHRILFDTGANAQRGDDVKVVRRNTLERLEARGIERTVGPNDGVFSKNILSAAKTAAHFLGVPDDWTESNSGLLVREQRVIIYPETRTEGMLAAASARMDKLLADRHAAEVAAGRVHSGAYSLSATDRARAVKIMVAAFRLAFQHAGAVHYTQSGARFGGIRGRLRYADGRYPTQEDCSSMYTWAFWNGITSVAGMTAPDLVNGANWTAGYTGTLLSHGRQVPISNRRGGDAVIYGTGFPGHHVAMVDYNDHDMVYSHGSESGPYHIKWNYRSDIMQVRRYL